METPKSVNRRTLRQRLGWDAIVLLKHPDHRVVFVVAGLVAIPLASFYPYSPPNMRELGFQHTSAWMALGQVTELIWMFTLGHLLTRFRLKWIFLTGLIFTVLRFVFCALNTKLSLLVGIFLHGASYAPVYATAQIYLDQRVDPSWRARAQALILLANTGFGNLFGYLGVGAWFAYCSGPGGTRWPLFWSGMAASSAVVLVYFLAVYRGRKRENK
jgi:MFS family permease